MTRETANELIQEALIGGVIEGFGLLDQLVFVQIKKEDNYRIDIESYVTFGATTLKNADYTAMLLAWNTYFLQEIKQAYSNEAGALVLEFASKPQVIIGIKQDPDVFFGEEPWQLGIWDYQQETKLLVFPEEPAVVYAGFGDWNKR